MQDREYIDLDQRDTVIDSRKEDSFYDFKEDEPLPNIPFNDIGSNQELPDVQVPVSQSGSITVLMVVDGVPTTVVLPRL